jgi:tetratricopeptide (TPR) repeat protein
MKLMKFSILTCLLFSTIIAQAQYIKDYRREADRFYEAKDWQNAALNYEKFLTSKKGLGRDYIENNPYAVKATEPKKGTPTKPVEVPKNVSLKLINYRIAESYKNLDNYKLAEPWFAKVVASDKESYPLSPYYYGVCLRALAKYDEAQTQFSNFLESYKADDDFKKKATAELNNLKFIIAQTKGKEQKLFVVNKMQDGINTTEHGQNTAPFVSNGNLYFTSSRPDTIIVKKQKKAIHNNNLFSYKQGTAPAKAGLPIDEDMHQGSASFTPDGKTVYFTRWAIKGAKIASIYKSSITDNGTWGEPEKLGKDINVDGFSSQQPSITSDGKYLLYASNKTGGKGKFDLWYATLEDGKIGASVNFGEPVNSADDEITPFYHVPSKQLVFSSQGRVGMGGYDLFQAKGNVGGSFNEPKNLGYPVNSQKDEQYFYCGDEKFLLKNFYISSDRGSECCLELYTANKLIKKWITGRVVDQKTGQPVAGANLRITNDKGVVLPQVTTDNNGIYFKYVPKTDNKVNYQADFINPKGLGNYSVNVPSIKTFNTPPTIITTKINDTLLHVDITADLDYNFRPDTNFLGIVKEIPNSFSIIVTTTDSTGNCTQDLTSFYLTNNLTNSIDELTTKNKISIFPNPATTKLTVNSETAIKEIYIYDLLGKLVKQMNVENTNTKSNEIAIDELNQGIYIIQVIDVFDAKLSSKFIKE